MKKFSLTIAGDLEKSAEILRINYQAGCDLKRLQIILPERYQVDINVAENLFINSIIEGFCLCFVLSGRIIYIGDIGSKYLHFCDKLLVWIRIVVDRCRRLLDLVVCC